MLGGPQPHDRRAADGPAAPAGNTVFGPDAIILDIAMPGLNGFEALREIRLSAGVEQTPIIIHSSRMFSPEELTLLANSRVVVYPKQPLGDEQSLEKLQQALQSAGVSL